MPRPSRQIADSFVSHLKALEKTRSKMELLFSSGTIVRRDLEQVYSGLYLDAITSFENLIEDLFIGLLVGRLTPSRKAIAPRATILSDRVAREIVFGGQSYVDWFPYRHTIKRAEAFFSSGQPFTKLEKPEKKTLEHLLYIRNAIAHQSSHSIRMFEREVIGALALTPRERTPAGFLRSLIRITPRQTRYESYMSDIAVLAKKLCS